MEEENYCVAARKRWHELFSVTTQEEADWRVMHFDMQRAIMIGNASYEELIEGLEKFTHKHGTIPRYMFINSHGWAQLASDASKYSNIFDPVTKYELIKEGRLGSILGMEVLTDGFVDPDERFITDNCIA